MAGMDAGMDCEQARDAVSARIDGEVDAGELERLDLHLGDCADCRAWEARAYALRRTVVLRHPLPPDHLADQVLARLSVPQTGVGEWVRYALGVVAAALVLLNLPLLVGLEQLSDVGGHDSRHLGTFGVALGIGLLWAAFRPERAIGLVPLAGALAATTLVAAGVDLAAGRTGVLTESTHLFELVGLGLLWYLSGGPHRLQHRFGHHGHRVAPQGA